LAKIQIISRAFEFDSFKSFVDDIPEAFSGIIIMNCWTVRIEETASIVTLRGTSFDVAVAVRFREQIRPLLDQYSQLVIDFASVEYADSCGLGVIASLVSAAKPGQFSVCGVSASLARSIQRLPKQFQPTHRKHLVLSRTG
jgi:anti-anti-sigma factor